MAVVQTLSAAMKEKNSAFLVTFIQYGLANAAAMSRKKIRCSFRTHILGEG